LVVSADLHQPLLGAFANDQPNTFSRLGIQKAVCSSSTLSGLFGEGILCQVQASDVERAVEGAQLAQ
jgi:hypothetical protein